jgi:hypothetical protein
MKNFWNVSQESDDYDDGDFKEINNINLIQDVK